MNYIKKLFLVFILLSGFPLYASEDPIEVRAIPKFEAHFLNKSLQSRSLKDKLIFKRDIENENFFPDQRMSTSEKTFHEISQRPAKGIYFRRAMLSPFDYAGTCSAMSLDFLSRYLNRCYRKSLNKDEIELCVQQF